VGVAMSEDDVLHVGGAEAEPLDLLDGGVGLVELEPGQVDQMLADPLGGVPHVEQADPRVHEGEAGLIFEQQTMADDSGAGRLVQESAVDVVSGGHRASCSSPIFIRPRVWRGGGGGVSPSWTRARTRGWMRSAGRRYRSARIPQ